jgi:DNA replication protein DnaC
MTTRVANCLSTMTTRPASSERQCPGCGAVMRLPVIADAPVFDVAVWCDPCADRELRRRAAAAEDVRLRGLWSSQVRAGLLTESFWDATWSRSDAEVEGMNASAWRDGRGWYLRGPQNLYVFGAVGVGKTFLARCCLHEAFRAGRMVAEVTARRLCKVSDTYREGDGAFDAWKRSKVLLIDDVDKASWNMERVGALWELLDARASAGRRTIMAANIDSGELMKLLQTACSQGGLRNESHAVATLDRMKPVLKLELRGTSRRGHA